ncbi:MAG: hypothetical protein IPK52_24995 [Chloroflexi bacterium]|nr:hypothetical protein [Chloroflexota bacterium]
MRRLIALLVLLIVIASSVSAVPPSLGGCQMFPADNAWNTNISGAAVHPNSANYIANILANGGDFVHPDFGGDTNDWYGIPWTTATSSTPLVNMSFDYDDESDPGPYPIPVGAPIEGGAHLNNGVSGDRHILVVETTNCILYEVYSAYPDGVGGFDAGSGAVYDLGSNDLRPEGWTSADAAGLPILPGLANCAEANSGTISHALRFTVSETQRAFIYPATHFASSNTGANFPPMGLRLRLKAGYNTSGLTGQALAIATALKQYGMILADNGSNWFISGEYNPACWDDDQLNDLKSIPGSAFEVIVSPPPPSEVPGDLIKNGGFEAGLTAAKKPAFWTLLVNKDRRRCSQNIDIPGVGLTSVGYQGRCAFEFKGTGTVDVLKQNVKLGLFAVGSTVEFDAFVALSNVLPGSAKIKAKLVYSNGTSSSVFVDLPNGSADYAPVGFTLDELQVTNLSKIKLKITHTSPSGKLWLDALSLVLIPPAPRALPLPPAAG